MEKDPTALQYVWFGGIFLIQSESNILIRNSKHQFIQAEPSIYLQSVTKYGNFKN